MEQVKNMEQKLPTIAVTHSIKVNVEMGKTYLWCACGNSNNQPFCDGSHHDTPFTPIAYKAEENKLIGFCGCKYSKTPPYCDGAHKTL